tara:strand:+ start:13988 stop:15337 length:1350 start_codon:yes stop_codon:yes gene_type:complete
MPVVIPTSKEVDTQGQSYVRAEIPELSAISRKGSFVSGLTTSFFLAVHGLYRAFKRYADNEPFPQTASAGFFKIGWWLDITGLQQTQPAAATGSVVITGTNGTVVSAGTAMAADGIGYTSDVAVSIINQTIAGVSSISVDPSIAIFTTETPHNLATGMTVTFSGCIDAVANGAFEIRVVDAETIEYSLTSEAAGPVLAGNPLLSGTWAGVSITADVVGTGSNLTSGANVTIAAPPVGADATALATFGGLADGSDLETLEAWRTRVLEGLAVDYGMFTADEIKILAKTVPGVTRVFVRRPTETPLAGYPLEGQVRIAFLRDNDAGPIPSAAEVEQVRAKIHSQLLPAHMTAADCEVLAPERYVLAVRFISISPDTPGMRASIRDNLLEFLADKAGWGGVLYIEDIRCAIRDAYDSDTGQGLITYELDTPTLDIALPVDAFPVLETVQWSL